MKLDAFALAARRQALIHRSDVLREAIAQDLQAGAPLFAVADGVGLALRWAGRHKLLLGAGLGLGLLLRPKVGLRWIRRAFFALGIYRRAGALWQKSLALWQRMQG